ncbi:MAG TPA: nucleotide exchange factor GrpE [Pseudonocardia sp.]|nr:nucleotide exchange factor GrpE [Pseudonocardia sp.]
MTATEPLPAGDQQAVAALSEALAVLREQLDRVHRRHEELAAEARSRADDPLIRDLLLTVDACARNARTWADRPTAEPADVADALLGVVDDLGLVLARVGVEAFEPEPGEVFDRRSARAARVEPVADPAASGRVVRVLRPGYRSGERVVRYAEVVVGRHQEGPTP